MPMSPDDVYMDHEPISTADYDAAVAGTSLAGSSSFGYWWNGTGAQAGNVTDPTTAQQILQAFQNYLGQLYGTWGQIIRG